MHPYSIKAAQSAVLAILFSNSPSQLHGAPWMQYRGSTTDGISPEKWTLKSYVSTNGLPRAWQMKAETGFSSFTIADGKAFTIVGRQVDGVKREVLVALGAADGKELWAAPFGIARYDGGGDSGGGSKDDAGKDGGQGQDKNDKDSGSQESGDDAGQRGDDGGSHDSPPPENSEDRGASATPDERILNDLERAPLLQQELSRRAAQNRRVRGAADK